MANTHYNPFNKGGWTFGERMAGYNEWHLYLGPCPKCGTACFDYGGGWRCLGHYCSNNASNPIGNLGPSPAWWNTGIQVKKDGDAWCAHHADFINLQESDASFGATPAEAVKALLTPVNK